MMSFSTNTRHLVIDEALSWLDTPWKNQQQIKGTGVDCINLLLACAQVAGMTLNLPPEVKSKTYERIPRYSQVKLCIESNFRATDQLNMGDILLFSIHGDYNHVGLYYQDDEFIHSCAGSKGKGKVKIDQLSRWKSKLKGKYDLLSYEQKH